MKEYQVFKFRRIFEFWWRREKAKKWLYKSLQDKNSWSKKKSKKTKNSRKRSWLDFTSTRLIGRNRDLNSNRWITRLEWINREKSKKIEKCWFFKISLRKIKKIWRAKKVKRKGNLIRNKKEVLF